MPIKVHLYGVTDVGRQRDHNEDSFGIFYHHDKGWEEIVSLTKDISNTKGIIAVVADGMGGANAGEVASEMAVKTVKEELKSNIGLVSDTSEYASFLKSVVTKAHNNIVALARQNKEMKGMGTTIVLAWIVRDYLYVVWSGDSRCYYYNKYRDKNLEPFTEDHSLVWTRVKNDEITAEEARLSSESNLILQSLGDNNQKPKPGFIWTKLEENDRILLCSDGLNSMLSDIGIQQIIEFSDSTKDTCLSLIQAANSAGGNDNITVIVIDITSSKSKPPQEKSKPVEKKPFYAKHVFLGVLILIVFGIIYHQNILEYYKENTGDLLGNYSADATYNTGNQNDKSKNTQNNNEEEYITVIKDTLLKVENAQPMHKKTSEKQAGESRLDSTFVISELTKALETIERAKLRLAQFEPEGSTFKEDFYRLRKSKLDSISNALDSLTNEIEKIAQVNINSVVRLYDYDYAINIYLPINELLVAINDEIKITIETN